MLCVVFSIQLSSHMKSHDKYAHIDAQVTLRLDSMPTTTKPPLRKAISFVFIMPELQSEIDTPECSLFQSALLDYWSRNARPAVGVRTAMCAKEDLSLHVSEVDNHCQKTYDKESMPDGKQGMGLP